VVWQDNRDGPWNIYAAALDGSVVADCAAVSPGDLDGNCRVDFADLAVMASSWLVDLTDGPRVRQRGPGMGPRRGAGAGAAVALLDRQGGVR
jgi:hypothetical protein